MKPILNILLVSTLLISCAGNDDISEKPKPTEKTLYNLEYKNYLVKNVTLYKGPIAQESDPGESYLTAYWGTYQEPIWGKISLDIKNSSLQLISETSAGIKYTITMDKDSVFINDHNELTYIGNFNREKSSFTLKRSLRYVKKVPRTDFGPMFISQTNTFGVTQYETIFGKSAFNKPAEMTESGDVVLWSNIEYQYQ
ncbi:hypothetical protein [Chryseobacterium proteolyticum]|uniref:hypothetical protein n=1 Tax=Chryseobacterium proteolyticum TaxID=118127 RepID=UPI003983987A